MAPEACACRIAVAGLLERPPTGADGQHDIRNGGYALLGDEEFRLALGSRPRTVTKSRQQALFRQRVVDERRVAPQREPDVRGTPGVHRCKRWEIALVPCSDQHRGRTILALDVHVHFVERHADESKSLIQRFADFGEQPGDGRAFRARALDQLFDDDAGVPARLAPPAG